MREIGVSIAALQTAAVFCAGLVCSFGLPLAVLEVMKLLT